MAILSGKLADIVLPIDHFGTHLNMQGKVIDLVLALWNYQYAGGVFCDIWRYDLIFGKSVDARYVKEFVNPFENLQFEGTEKKKQKNENDKKNKKRNNKKKKMT